MQSNGKPGRRRMWTWTYEILDGKEGPGVEIYFDPRQHYPLTILAYSF